MTKFNETSEAADFIATADSRETSREIMEAIAFFARDAAEADALWNGDGFGTTFTEVEFWEHVTGNGARSSLEFYWGALGSDWWDAIQG
jgi:hypothetical protein